MSYNINSHILTKKKICGNSHALAINTQHLFMLVTRRHAKHMLIMSNLKSAQNEHKNERFNAYKNVARLQNIVHHCFFCLCKIYAIAMPSVFNTPLRAKRM